ncbi:MAG TPA: hypothetical protein VGI14_14875 [Casimicrobiaceae bacterium]|jgi:hypothetical protein
MPGILIAVFESRLQAEAARAALLEGGFHDGQIGIEGGDAHADSARNRGAGAQAADANAATAGSEDRGLAGVIERMFSGFATDPDPRSRSYADVVAHGGCLLALHGLDDGGMVRAASIVRDHGATDVQPHGETASRERTADPGDLQAELAAVSSVGGPQVYALPNAPVDWRRTGGRVGSQRLSEDPAQPQGRLGGADDLAPSADRDLLQRRRE